MNKKIMCFLLVFGFLIFQLTNSSANPVKDEDSKCYGFIVTYVAEGNYSIIDRINCKIRHLINDLLREQIPVYWIAEGINVDIKKMNSSYKSQNKLFEPGSFIIPFTGNSIDDKKIISVIYDYNQSSEIETYDELTIPIYIVMEQINAQVFPLKEVKTAVFYSRATSAGFFFLEVLSKCGFLNVELIENKDINSKLNLDDFNVLFRPGGLHDHSLLIRHSFYEDIAYRESDGVRDFINNGGGYIGACNGLVKASAGGIMFEKLPFPIYLKRRVYNPNLRSIGVYAIADFLFRPPPRLSYDVQVKIIDNSSPITYGLNEIEWDSWFGGPMVYRTGENVNIIANYHNTETKIDGTPSWLTANFGKGKIAIYSTHPEIAGIGRYSIYKSKLNTGKIVISNSLFHTTAEDEINYQTHHSKNLTYLEEIWEATANLTNGIGEIEKIFNPIREKINETNHYLAYLTDKTSEIISLIKSIADENQIDNSTNKYRFYLGLEFVKDVRKFYYPLFTEFFENATTVFDKIELINNLLKNDSNFKEQLKTFMNDTSDKINKAIEILQNGEDTLDDFKQKLLKYQQKTFRSRIKEELLKRIGNTFYIHIYPGVIQALHTYFDSLKFLRQNWYNYETSIIV